MKTDKHMRSRMAKVAFAAGLFASALSAVAATTPETSRLFKPYTDPKSGVTSYLLKPGLVGHNQQSIYFTAKSMTEDGRFLVLDVSCDESLPKEKRAWTGKRKALVDFEKDEIFMLGKDTRSGSDVPCLDTERDQFYYFRLAPGDDRRKDALCDRLDCFGNLPDVCEGTGITNDKAYYYARKRVNGDPHGQAPMLWICASLMAND